jgi:DNA-binding SARP family transcriptional activator
LRIARAASALSGDPADISRARGVTDECAQADDEWGQELAALFTGIGALRASGADPAPLEMAAAAFRRRGAGVLECWAQAYLALAQCRSGDDEGRSSARSAAAMARSTGVRGAEAVALHAQALSSPAHRDEVAASAAALADECGLCVESDDRHPERPDEASESSGLEVRCFGGLAVRRDGLPVDIAAVRPRARELLRVLAAHGGRPVHAEVLIEALWPGAEPRAGLRSLQVAISTLRHLLDPGASPRHSTVVRREGDAYRLAAARIDVAEFERLTAPLSEWNDASGPSRTEERLRAALDLQVAELCPEAGPADWAVGRREQLRAQAADAAVRLSRLQLGSGRSKLAARTSARGLALDPDRDDLWQVRLAALAASGENAALNRARTDYAHRMGALIAG